QSIDDSNADLAKDLRVLVRERLKAGDSDKQVLDYVVSRYGEFVLLKPVMAPHTLVLWFAAPALLLIGLVGIGFSVMRRKRAPRTLQDELTAEEKARLDALLEGE
ncbi:MAG: cytochrome c-type biogenesis protein CcmH, partial [Rhodobiaceae bacterium]|nr:cytochrome c-type biogenesis protein CcmH [Rhodobiaceae bacterium]